MTNTHKLKLWVCVACLASSLAAPAYEPTLGISMDLIDLAAISRMSPHQLEALAEGLAAQEIMRTKRSSAAALGAAVASKASSGLSSGLSSKVGLLGQASAGAVSLISSASSKSGHSDDHSGYSYEPHESKVDFWGLKKSILYTLFQAVKAITGGVTILKGQLIKGSGALATTLGKVIKVKGEAVSNFGKKIVNSAALSHKGSSSSTTIHHHHASPVYGPPAPTHLEYPPSAYGAPTAPAHYHAPPTASAHYHAPPSGAPSGPPSGFSSHKYQSQLDGRGKLNGVHAGLVILAPLGEEAASNVHGSSTPLEPPPSILNSAFSAIKNVFSPAATGPAPSAAYSYPSAPSSYAPQSTGPNQDIIDQPPPPPQPYKTWGAVNSYGEPVTVDAYPNYDPRNPNLSSDRYSSVPKHSPPHLAYGLNSEKLNKISANLDKIAHLTAQHRSSEELPHFDGLDVYRQMLMKGMKIPLLPTPVVTDADIKVKPENSSAEEKMSSSSSTTTSTTTTTAPMTDDKTRRRKDIKYILKGNRIVQV